MPNQLIYDNWTLQDVKDLYSSGLSDDSASKIVIDGKNDTHSFQDIPRGYIQIEVLFSFLQNLILRDLIIVDDRFTSAWDQDLKLRTLQQEGLIKGHNFRKDKIFEVRRAIIDQACVTTSIARIQKKNEEQFQKDGTTFDPLMSQIIWGGAGMLARSHVYETFYIPHPLRRYAFEQTPILSRDAVSITQEIIQSSRTKLFQYQNSMNNGIHASFSLAPLIVKVIEEANDVEDLLIVSLQLRDEYKKLRSWIKQFQKAIETDKPKEVLEYSKLLKSVQKNIESKFNPDKNGSLNLGFNLFNISPTVSKNISAEWLKNKFGVRSTLNDLILTPSGFESFKKFFSLFGERNTALSKKISDQLIKNYSTN